MQRTITGLRIRERRREMGIKQIDLAARVGVSASYLNLIERNRRAVAGALLARIGRELDLRVEELDGSAERRLREALEELAAEPGVVAAEGEARPGPADEFIARHPGWARAAAFAHRRWREAAAEAEAMADRLAHDPALAASVHAMRTEIAALRSTAEILAEGREISVPQRRRFETIMFEQSSRLAGSVAKLAAYFDEAAENRLRPAPKGRAEEALADAPEIGPRIEAMAEAARAKLEAEGDIEAALRRATPRPPEAPPEAGRAARLAALALAYTRQVHRRALFDLAEALSPEPGAEDLLALIEAELAQRLADAILAPGPAFLALGARLGWEVGALARAFDGDGALVMRRLACLGGMGGAPRAAHVEADASGRVLARRGALDLLPRARALDCPVWPVHRAAPGPAPLPLPLRLADGSRLLALGLAREGRMAGDMLAMTAESAAGTAYAAAAGAAPEPVGPECRICPHAACPWRREPAAVG